MVGPLGGASSAPTNDGQLAMTFANPIPWWALIIVVAAAGYLAHLASPFRWRRLRRAAGATAG